MAKRDREPGKFPTQDALDALAEGAGPDKPESTELPHSEEEFDALIQEQLAIIEQETSTQARVGRVVGFIKAAQPLLQAVPQLAAVMVPLATIIAQLEKIQHNPNLNLK